eukprot:CAMPEP_0114998892 /NCGR_PEP_ID=MMETSP0216-20121206/15797_1 /TAXON_ID=223996 /ORGANISM="Protocruzia adherens, Strain Boccale" /LENGTH=340 /DNA_ID=CAMNT_0002363615 /DNA_START=49 /DNA_END=1068 /DNA_ORIENTATION=+
MILFEPSFLVILPGGIPKNYPHKLGPSSVPGASGHCSTSDTKTAHAVPTKCTTPDEEVAAVCRYLFRIPRREHFQNLFENLKCFQAQPCCSPVFLSINLQQVHRLLTKKNKEISFSSISYDLKIEIPQTLRRLINKKRVPANENCSCTDVLLEKNFGHFTPRGGRKVVNSSNTLNSTAIHSVKLSNSREAGSLEISSSKIADKIRREKNFRSFVKASRDDSVSDIRSVAKQTPEAEYVFLEVPRDSPEYASKQCLISSGVSSVYNVKNNLFPRRKDGEFQDVVADFTSRANCINSYAPGVDIWSNDSLNPKEKVKLDGASTIASRVTRVLSALRARNFNW